MKDANFPVNTVVPSRAMVAFLASVVFVISDDVASSRMKTAATPPNLLLEFPSVVICAIISSLALDLASAAGFLPPTSFPPCVECGC